VVELPNMKSLTICFVEDILGNTSFLVFDVVEEAFSPLFNLEGRVRERVFDWGSDSFPHDILGHLVFRIHELFSEGQICSWAQLIIRKGTEN